MPKLKNNGIEEITKNVFIQKYYIYNGIKYIVDNKNVVIEYSPKELEVARWLVDTFGGIVKILPKINWPENIKTPDYIFNNEKWDLKEIRNATSKTRAVDNVIKNQKHQATNFIIDITGCQLSNIVIIKQVKKIMNSVYREWVNKIIIKKNYRLVKILTRK